MYILSMDKKLLMEFGRLEVSRNLTGKQGEKYCLSAWGRAIANPVTVGLYPDEASAMAELSHIIQALYDGQKVYQIG